MKKELSTEEILTRSYGQCLPSNNKNGTKLEMRLFKGTAYPLTFP